MDLLLIETGNGGDLVKTTKDVTVINGFQNMPYLAMFGGNIEQSTPTKRLLTQQALDWWGNTLLMPNNESLQLNSETERMLNTVALNSEGRILVENAIKKDLQVMAPFATVTVECLITATDRIEILIRILKPGNLQATQFVYIWDATMSELTMVPSLGDAGAVFKIFGPEFDFSFE